MDQITLLLAIEAQDKATKIVDSITSKIGAWTNATKAGAAAASRSSAEIQAANTKAAASTASYERAVASQAKAQAALSEAMLASKAAQLEAAAAAREGSAAVAASAKAAAAAVDAEEAGLIRLQEAERLAATRSKELAAAQEAANGPVAKHRDILKGVAVAAGATALAVGYVGEKAVKAAGDFQSSSTRWVASAGEVSANLDKARQGVLRLEGDVGYSTEQLTDGFYKASSAGFNFANGGLTVLRAAAEGAKSENADLSTVVDAVSSAMVDYHAKAGEAADITSQLVAATSQGKTTFEQLAGAMPAILPTASAAHVALSDILGDLSAMTVHGMSAQQAAQNLADVIRHMTNPTSVQAKELALLGMTTTQLAGDLKTKGLSGTLQEISGRIAKLMPPGSDKVILNLKTALNSLPPAVQKLGLQLLAGSISMGDYSKAVKALDPISAKQAMSFGTLAGASHRIGDAQTTGAKVMQNYTQALAKATGDASGLNVALMLTGENADRVNGAVKTIAASTHEAGGHVKGWAEIQGNFNQKMSELKGKLDAAKISIGTGLLPAVTAIATKVMAVVGPITAWMTNHQKLSAIILGSLGGLAAFVAVVIGAIKAFDLIKTAVLGVRTAMVFLKLATIEADAAFALSPIGIVVIALVALAAAVYYCWTHFAGFRKVVIEAWNGIKSAAMATWNGFLKPTFNAIQVAIMKGVVPAMLWLWHNVIQPAWAGIKVAIGIAWAAIKVYWDVIKVEIAILAAIFTWLWHNVIEPAWQGIQVAISVAWAAIQVIWGLIQIEIKILAAIFMWLWHNVIEPAWKGIAAIISWAWNNIVKPIWDLIKLDIKILETIFMWLWHNVIEPAWKGIASAISAVWTNVIKPVFGFFGSIIKDYVVPGFKSGVDAIGKAWGLVVDIAKAPVRFVVNTVLNDGLLAAYNWVAKTFGVKPDNVHIGLPKGFATGGAVWGQGSETSDSILALLSRGEHVLTAEEVRRAGGHARVAAWRSALMGSAGPQPTYPGDPSGLVPGFARGGIVDTLSGLGSKLWDLFTSPGKVITGAVNSLINHIPGGGAFRDTLVGGAHKMLSGLLSWITGGGGAQGNVGKAMAFLKSQVGKPYIWASAGPAGFDCSGLVSAVYRVVRGMSPPYVHQFSTGSEAPYFPKAGPGGVLTAAWTVAGEHGIGGSGVGHTAGMLAGLPFESVGGQGVRVGSSVSPLSGFAHIGHFDAGGPLHPGWTAAYNGTGHDEWVSNGGGGTVVFDFSGSKVMTDRDIDVLIDKIDRRLVRTKLPGAGVHVRR